MARTPSDATALLISAEGGSHAAAEELVPLVYDELHALAASFMRGERPGHMLQTTALVHEAYMRLIRQDRTDWRGRAHFTAIAARLIRQILIDDARKRDRQKRGGPGEVVTFAEELTPGAERPPEILALDEALQRLAAIDERQAQVVEMRFFGGLTVEETAHVLGVSPRTVNEEWRMARAWLSAALDDGDSA